MIRYLSLGLLFITLPAFSAEECVGVTVSVISSGPQNNGLIKLNNNECGNEGWVCAHAEGAISYHVSSQLFSLALAAKATNSKVDVSWSNSHGCNGDFPMINNLSIK